MCLGTNKRSDIFLVWKVKPGQIDPLFQVSHGLVVSELECNNYYLFIIFLIIPDVRFYHANITRRVVSE